jgi:hypothetical protein
MPLCLRGHYYIRRLSKIVENIFQMFYKESETIINIKKAYLLRPPNDLFGLNRKNKVTNSEI